MSVPAELGDIELLGRPSRLTAHVAHVFDCAQVLRLFEYAGEMDARGLRMLLPQLGPAGNQLLVQRVELVATGLRLLEPIPLRNRRFEQRGRGIGIVFEQLWR